MSRVFCCCRQSKSVSLDPNTVSVLPTGPGKPWPDHKTQSKVSAEFVTGVPELSDNGDLETSPDSSDQDSSVLGAVGELDRVINNELVEFYDCIDDNNERENRS